MIYRQMKIEQKFPKWEIAVRKGVAFEIMTDVLLFATAILYVVAMVFFCGKSDYAWLADFVKPVLTLAVHWLVWALCFGRVWGEDK